MFTVGTDVEFFLKKEGKFVSAIPHLQGKKHSPQILSNGGNLIHDNVALEFATPVAECEDSFIKIIRETLQESITFVPSDVVLDSSPSTDFPEEELDTEEARMFGCDPDYGAWELAVNEVPFDAPDKPFRSVGGHLHVGFVEGSGNEFLQDPMGKVLVVKVFDVFLGIPMTIFDNGPATVARRRLYGKAGCHRPTDYGVEYRSMSNYWTLSPKLVSLVYRLAGESMRIIREGKHDEVIGTIGIEEIQRVINEADVKAAKFLWRNTISNYLNDDLVRDFNKLAKKKKFNLYKEWNI